ncbi:hypothetical protein BHM03_00010778 [Ensete ventricosum]|nr:hypothetical protein BHM03_00010778 [Ensete ventricosum]
MGGTLGFSSGSRLLEWWSTGRAEVFQLGSAADSCKKVESGRSFYSECCRLFVPGNLTALMAYHAVIPFHHVCRPCVAFQFCTHGLHPLEHSAKRRESTCARVRVVPTGRTRRQFGDESYGALKI